MNRDLFLSILAMDSYNRGYGAGVSGVFETGQIGNATIRTFGPGEQDGWQAAGFYASAYVWNGETIISYRGTNFGLDLNFARDVMNGWSIFTGLGSNFQLALAAP